MGRPAHGQTEQKEGFFTKAAIAGCSCAVVSACLNPFDVTKIRMQNQSEKLYTGMIHGIRRILTEEGPRGLLKGVETSMIREVCYSSIRIGGYEPIRKVLTKDGSNPADTSPLVKLFSALLSGAIGSAFANPLDLIKTRLQAVLPHEATPYRHTFHGLAAIFQTEGFGGLYKGWMVTSARAAVLTSSQLGSYDSIKHNLLMKVFGMEDGLALHLTASMMAGLTATTATNPFDVIKTRYLSDQAGKYTGIIDCVVKTFKQDGIQGFFKGWTPAYWRLGPHTVMSFLLIEEIRAFIGLSTI